MVLGGCHVRRLSYYFSSLICDVLLQTEEHYSLVDCCTSWRQGIRSVLERIHLALWGIAGFSTTQRVGLLMQHD